MWFTARVSQGYGAARRAGMAISKKVRASLGKVEGASGIGDDETSLSGGGSRAWWDAFEEAAAKVREFLEKSTFVRIGKLEAWVRKKLGLPPRVTQAAQVLPAVTTPAPRRTAQRGSVPLDSEQAARLRAQVQLLRTQANTSRPGAVPKARVSVTPPPAPELELRRTVEETQPEVRAHGGSADGSSGGDADGRDADADTQAAARVVEAQDP